MGKILVTGATGHLGSAVVDNLLERIPVADIVALARDTEKAKALTAKGVAVIAADYDNYDSLVSAFRGIEKLYFVSSSDIVNRLAQHQNVVNAAMEAGVKHIIYTSAQRKLEDGSSAIAFVADAHWKTDQMIKDSGLEFTILKHGLYSDILPMFMGPDVINSGTIFLPAGSGSSSYVSRSDLAKAASIILTNAGHEGKIYEFGGKESVSFHDIAELLSELSGKKIQYVSPSQEDFVIQLQNFGVAAQDIEGLATFCAAIAQGEFDSPSFDLEKILGGEPQTVREFLKTSYGL
ncbi:SDR family oxidoreductase [Flavobacterium pectinovorum]|uniref:NAD(P)-dependent oxidoreductase n=1 Tax=Flavobacterium pectinovorum TaxID=29533 RepID=A0AB36P6B2_9FLAO|nr:SDR family oxidoreductase [Flavobacterium pectinovorum]OXB07756.1 NAD(P)-dependent oxidoreductase [Flavobacterium pectinovorum]SHM79450.1 NAD(P)H dehydrogenase (quinone) [Flavobacterium pectinovorum]